MPDPQLPTNLFDYAFNGPGLVIIGAGVLALIFMLWGWFRNRCAEASLKAVGSYYAAGWAFCEAQWNDPNGDFDYESAARKLGLSSWSREFELFELGFDDAFISLEEESSVSANPGV